LTKKKSPSKAAPSPHIPPSVAESPEQLEKDAAALAGGAPGEERRGPGRPPGSKTKKPGPVPAFEFPLEALALAHKGIWDFAGDRLRSDFRISTEGALEMARFADLCLRQYVMPFLADHAALAGYLLTQVSTLAAMIASRRPGKVAPQPAPKEGTDAP
jgi:hypothetical protein